MSIRNGIALTVVGVLIGGLALLGALSLVRGTPVSAVLTFDRSGEPPAVGEELFTSTMELYTGTDIAAGNTVEVLQNGDETYPRLWRDLRAAKRTISLQSYYSQPGAMADTLSAILVERARRGVRVLVLLDALGSQNLTDEWVEGLTSAGVQVAIMRPFHWYTLQKANHRSHVRAVVVDGRVGYTGGFGVADKWFGQARTPDEWRETNVRFTGPAVMHLQGAFATGWAEATGDLLVGDIFFPPERFEPTGTTELAFLHAVPTAGSSSAERFFALSLASARRTIYIANSYSVPDDDFRRLMIAAVKRGVDVRLLTAGDRTDVKTTMYAGRSSYEELLKGGVRIYEYLPTMIHAKTFVIDGLWCTVGSANFDNRSLAFNDESNLMVLDERIGAQMDSVFLADLARAEEITLATFRKRGVHKRALEIGASMLSRLL